MKGFVGSADRGCLREDGDAEVVEEKVDEGEGA